MTDRAMLRVADILEELQFESRATLYRAMKADPGFPPPFRLQRGGHPRWSRESIERWKAAKAAAEQEKA